jgi:acyl-CoA synthetase (AMP-forming)/AMP-acid ligase II
MFHVNAWSIPYGAAVAGAKLVFPGPKHGRRCRRLQRLIATEARERSTAGVPTVWLALACAPAGQTGERLPSLRRVIVGGAACPRAIMEEFETQARRPRAPRLGHDRDEPGWDLQLAERRFCGTLSPRGSVARSACASGGPSTGVEVKRRRCAAGKELPWDGKYLRRSLQSARAVDLCAEYFRVGRRAMRIDDDGWFETGDVATIDRRGYVAITDRTKDVIKSGGEWISSMISRTPRWRTRPWPRRR